MFSCLSKLLLGLFLLTVLPSLDTRNCQEDPKTASILKTEENLKILTHTLLSTFVPKYVDSEFHGNLERRGVVIVRQKYRRNKDSS